MQRPRKGRAKFGDITLKYDTTENPCPPVCGPSKYAHKMDVREVITGVIENNPRGVREALIARNYPIGDIDDASQVLADLVLSGQWGYLAEIVRDVPFNVSDTYFANWAEYQAKTTARNSDPSQVQHRNVFEDIGNVFSFIGDLLNGPEVGNDQADENNNQPPPEPPTWWDKNGTMVIWGVIGLGAAAIILPPVIDKIGK